MPQIHQLLNNSTSAETGIPFKVDEYRQLSGGIMPIQITITGTATVILEGSISEKTEINEGTAVWALIANATWTSNVCDGVVTNYPFIRARVSSYTSGNVSVRVQF